MNLFSEPPAVSNTLAMLIGQKHLLCLSGRLQAFLGGAAGSKGL